MALRDAIAAFAEDPDAVLELLDQAARDELITALEALADDPDNAVLMLRIVQLVAPVLPADHPVRTEVAAESGRYAQAARAWLATVTQMLEGLKAARTSTDAVPTPEDVRERIVRRLLGVPAVSPESVRDRGTDPEEPALIRLARLDGAVQLPAFQFDAAGRPRQVVLTVNTVLDAEHDPWAAASWWTRGHTMLGQDQCPSDLLDGDADEFLVALAERILED
jgi:hypothetical protein